MDIAITYGGPHQAQELRSLREWLPKADPALASSLREQTETSEDHLAGEILIGLVLTGISAAHDLTGLYKAVSGWVHNRFGRNVDTRRQVVKSEEGPAGTLITVKVGEVIITVSAAPGEQVTVISDHAE